MRLKNRFKTRFISHQKYVQWFTAHDFRAGIWAVLSNRNFRNNWRYTIKQQISAKLQTA